MHLMCIKCDTFHSFYSQQAMKFNLYLKDITFYGFVLLLNIAIDIAIDLFMVQTDLYFTRARSCFHYGHFKC